MFKGLVRIFILTAIAGAWFVTGNNVLAQTGLQDLSAPVLISYTVTPGTVDVTSAAQDIEFELVVTDDVSGVERVTVGLYDSGGALMGSLIFEYCSIGPPEFGEEMCGDLLLVSGDATNGTYRGVYSVRRFSAPGTWDTVVEVEDDLGQVNVYDNLGSGLPFPGGESGQVEIQNTGLVDLSAPVLTSLTFTPATADVTSASQEVVVELTVTDDASGIAYISLDVGQNTIGGGSLSYPPEPWDPGEGAGYLVRISGNETNGTYQGVITVPRFSPPATWESTMLISDAAGLGGFYGDDGSPWGGVPFPDGITGELVVLNSGIVDAAGPEITSFTLTPGTVDVTSASQPVVVDLTVTDDASGVDYIRVALLDSSLEYKQSLYYDPMYNGGLERITGDGTNGTYRGTFVVPQFTAPDVWEASVDISDSIGYWTTYGPDPFGPPITRPFPAGSVTNLVIQNNGRVDLAGPELISYTITPGAVDITSSNQIVEIELVVVDDASGVDYIDLDFYDAAQDTVESLFFSAGDAGVFGSLVRISGDGTNATYQGFFEVPRYTPPGTWTSDIFLEDEMGHMTYYGAHGEPFPGSATGTLDVQNSGPADLEAPVITFSAINPATVNVTSASQDITVDLVVTDDVSGVRELGINFHDSDGNWRGGLDFNNSPEDTLTRLSGDGTNGTYQGVFTVGQYTAPDTWFVSIYVRDNIDRYSSFSPDYGDPLPGGAPGQIEIFNTGVVDDAAPLITSYTITPGTVDVTSVSQDVLVQLEVTDDLSGVERIIVEFYDAAGRWYKTGMYFGYNHSEGVLARASGDALSGTYTGVITVAAFTPADTWTSYVDVEDAAGNNRFYSMLSGDPFPNGATGEIEVQNAGCVYSITPGSNTFAAAGGSDTVAVTTGAQNCEWTAVSNDAWITVTGGASGTGDGTVNYSVSANLSSVPRNGTITVAGETFTISQEGVSCSYAISPASRNHGVSSETGDISVTAPAGCAWSVSPSADWITLTGGSSGTGNGVVNYSVSANSSTTSRNGTITVAGETFTISQDGTACSYTIIPTARNHGGAPDTGSINVSAPEGCAWTATESLSWVSITSGASGSGNGTVEYAINENASVSSRSGTLNVAGQSFTVSQDGCSQDPSGNVVLQETSRPPLSWCASEGATWYQVWMGKKEGAEYPTYLNQWLNQTSGSWTPDVDLTCGQYEWWVRSWGPGNGFGAWEGPARFEVECCLPDAPAPVAPLDCAPGCGPVVYTWSAVSCATWYQLWINDGGGNFLNKWFQTGIQTGDITQTVGGHAFDTYHWWVRGWGPGGLGAWSSKGVTKIGGVEAAGLSHTQICWDDTCESGASYAQFWINRGTTNVSQDWINLSTLSGNCYDLPAELPSGTYSVWMRAWGETCGMGPWSEARTLSIP